MDLTAEQIAGIAQLEKKGIGLKFVENNVILVKQHSLVDNKLYCSRQLHRFVRDLFKEQHIKPITYNVDINTITLDWVLEKMKEYTVSRGDLVRNLAFTKEGLRDLFSNWEAGSAAEKVLLFYYFNLLASSNFSDTAV